MLHTLSFPDALSPETAGEPVFFVLCAA